MKDFLIWFAIVVAFTLTVWLLTGAGSQSDPCPNGHGSWANCG